MSFNVTILGSGAAIPTINSHPTAQLLQHNNQLFLIDCGEGTQVRLREQKAKFQRIHHIFISHLHGDHYLGLFGFLQTQHLLGRTNPITIFGPDGLNELIQKHLEVSNSVLNYPLIFKQTNSKKEETIYKDEVIEIKSFPLKHRIPTTGFLFKELPKPFKIKKEAIEKYQIGIEEIKNLKKGITIKRNGKLIDLSELTYEPSALKSYAFCSDTAYCDKILKTVKAVDVIYHEATFMEIDAQRAKQTFHSTAKQAATIALKAQAKKLLIGHFSNRYQDKLNELLMEGKSVFENTFIAEEGKTFEI
ncbi:MAG: ribonuclease Z [Vicingaceae bacterium]